MTITDFNVAVVNGDTHLSKWVCEHRTLQVQRGYLEFFRHLIPVGSTVIDVGACLGDHTATYSDFVGPQGRVIAYEPNPTAYECLEHNMTDLGNVTILNMALGDKSAMVGVNFDENLGGTHIEGKGDIAMTTLDNNLEGAHLGKVSFIKLDCEGYEAAVLRGGAGLIAKHKPAMLIELNPTCLEQAGFKKESIYEELTKLGYGWKASEPHISLDWDKIGAGHVDILCMPL